VPGTGPQAQPPGQGRIRNTAGEKLEFPPVKRRKGEADFHKTIGPGTFANGLKTQVYGIFCPIF
jgi:hypothetical protein